MADFNSSLPVRTQTNGDVVIFLADATTPSQLAAVDTHGSISSIIRDASGNAVTSQANGAQRALDVGIDVAGVQIDPRQIRALTAADVVTVSNFPTTVDTNYGTVGASTLRSAAQIGNATGAADFNSGATGAQTLRTVANQGAPNTAANGWPVKPTDGTNSQAYTAAGSAKTDIEQIVGATPSATNALPVQVTNGTAFNGPTAPLFVTMSDTVGSSVDNYQTSAALASSASANLDYTVTAGKTFYTLQVWASASGKIKVVVAYETGVATGVFNTFWVGFNSTAETNIYIPTPTKKTQIAGARIRITITNEDKAAMDVYSTLSGTEQ